MHSERTCLSQCWFEQYHSRVQKQSNIFRFLIAVTHCLWKFRKTMKSYGTTDSRFQLKVKRHMANIHQNQTRVRASVTHTSHLLLLSDKICSAECTRFRLLCIRRLLITHAATATIQPPHRKCFPHFLPYQ